MNFKISFIAALITFSFFSCKDVNKETNDSIIPTDTRSTMEYNENQLDSIPANTSSNDFKGGGDEPFWSVEIVDKQLHFQSPDENYMSIINTVDVSGSTITFDSENESESIKVALIEEECIDGMSGKKNSHKVEVSIKRSAEKDSKNFIGCGSFIKD